MESPEQRRRTMQAVKSKDTAPEMAVRRLIHALGYRFRLHRQDLPGCPDIVLPRNRKAILVHGCFWHGHNCSRGARTPKSNVSYWRTKIARNRARDALSSRRLRASGWKVLVIWECQVKFGEALERRLLRFLA